jgi:hypothetical protein
MLAVGIFPWQSNEKPPFLTSIKGAKACSVCGHLFRDDSKPSVSKAFVAHVREKHRPAAKEVRTCYKTAFRTPQNSA